MVASGKACGASSVFAPIGPRSQKHHSDHKEWPRLSLRCGIRVACPHGHRTASGLSKCLCAWGKGEGGRQTRGPLPWGHAAPPTRVDGVGGVSCPPSGGCARPVEPIPARVQENTAETAKPSQAELNRSHPLVCESEKEAHVFLVTGGLEVLDDTAQQDQQPSPHSTAVALRGRTVLGHQSGRLQGHYAQPLGMAFVLIQTLFAFSKCHQLVTVAPGGLVEWELESHWATAWVLLLM